ncbi:hypothetical protein [Clostridium sardiniense]|uniref:hypothetical protein n=1 Tax=Clostridium sardiniense TaxID=29369 RepID=UPI00195A15E8|nr:hypothetical protein [Clostridium sardiniense]MBM7836438.1 hypothetical protein [Clostridium sardiniense]
MLVKRLLNDKYFTTITSTHRNKIGQLEKGYIKSEEFPCNIQPIDEKAIKYTWGSEIKSNIQLFCEQDLLVNNILVNDNKIYKIEKKIPWRDYYLYALLESDVKIND